MKYKTINGWTKEKMIKQIKKYNNGKRAVNSLQTCLYETPDGNRCAVGCFIPDGHEALGSDGVVYEVLKAYPSLCQYMPLELNALRDLQEVHDDPYTEGDIRIALSNWINENVEDGK